MLPSLATLRTARAFAEILLLASSTFARDVHAKELVDLARRLELENAKEARTLWEAFGNFCRDELGTQPKKLVVMWFEVALPELEELEALTGDVKPERKEVERQKALIKEGWQTLVKGCGKPTLPLPAAFVHDPELLGHKAGRSPMDRAKRGLLKRSAVVDVNGIPPGWLPFRPTALIRRS